MTIRNIMKIMDSIANQALNAYVPEFRCRVSRGPGAGNCSHEIHGRLCMRLILLSIVLISSLLWGCAASTSTVGSDFISSAVPRIQKGVTTTSQLLNWLGEPYDKEQVTATEIKWLYIWARPTANVTVVPFGHRNIGTSGYKKTLLLIIKNDVVVYYNYAEGVI